MAESVITVSIITIACVICATVLVSAIYPAMNRATSTTVSTSVKFSKRIETSVEIIEEANQSSYEYVWVKNIGSAQLAQSQIEKSDVFFGKIGNFQRIPFNSALSLTPSWNYSIENDKNGNERWDTGETLNITIKCSTTIDPGDYFFKIVLYNAVSDEDTFSI